jgi:hypothetical protein
MPTWDDRIDEAARQLTEGQPRDGFGSRIIAGLDEPRRWSRAWLLAPAAAAIVVLAILAPREQPSDVSSTPDPTPTADVRLEPEVRGIVDTGRSTPLPPPTGQQRAMRLATTREALPPPSDPSLQPELSVGSIEIAPAEVSPVAIDALSEIPPLADEELTIPSLDAFSGQ